jgi:hypothetical protein
VATEAFYVNHWTDLEEAARGLEQSGRFLAKADDVPANRRDALPSVASDLAKESIKLREAANSQNEKETTASLQRIHLMIRELRLSN